MDEITFENAVEFFNTHESIAPAFPLNLPTIHVRDYTCICVNCLKTIPISQVRGNIEKTLENVFTLNAVAKCENCSLFNIHSNVRIREDDGQLKKQYFVQGTGWVEDAQQIVKNSFLRRVINRFL